MLNKRANKAPREWLCSYGVKSLSCLPLPSTSNDDDQNYTATPRELLRAQCFVVVRVVQVVRVLPRQVHGAHHHREDEGGERLAPLVSTLLLLLLITAKGKNGVAPERGRRIQDSLLLLLIAPETVTQILRI